MQRLKLSLPKIWIKKVNHYFSFQQNRKSGSLNGKQLKSDLELHESYIGLLPRLEALFDLAIKPDCEEIFNQFREKTSLKGASKSIFHSFILYADLQNPLLKRYAFDVDDFMEGAEKAFHIVSEGLSSVEFGNYAMG